VLNAVGDHGDDIDGGAVNGTIRDGHPWRFVLAAPNRDWFDG
jgi:hypothetical protein